MLVVIHVSIALTSIFYTGLTFFLPSRFKVHVSQVLIAATLISGTYLVVSTHANMISACVSGLIYLAIVSFGIVAAQNKLSKENLDLH